MYTVALTVGDTLQGAPVKTQTIRHYLHAAVDFIQKVGTRRDNPMIDPTTGKTFRPIEDCLTDFQKWETMPDRKSPLTKKMIKDLIIFTKDHHIDSKARAFVDWCIVGIHMGYRGCEWLSTHKPKHATDFPRVRDHPDKPIYQVLLDDMILIGSNGARVPDELTHPVDDLRGTQIKVRFQKNKQNGQIVSQARNTEDPDLCVTRAVQRIKQRAARLGLCGDDPASCYKSNPGSKRPSFFYTRLVVELLESMALRTYKIDNLIDSRLSYTPHSFRIGGCVVLHAAGADTNDIQTRLRWRSDKFKNYLRDLPQIAINHVKMFNIADVDSWA